MCWLLWKSWYSLLLDPDVSYTDDILTRGNQLVAKCNHVTVVVSSAPIRHVDQPRWVAPPHGCAKMNVDAAVSPTDHKAGVGGILRYEHGCWILGFASALVSSIKELLTREWSIVVRHVSRLSNRAADRLAARGRGLGTTQFLFSRPPADMVSVIEEESLVLGLVNREAIGIG
ncbi:hypothetical protein V6N12_035477 [Hibiscus sabdariffa]|uniref:RNase H type-1 domain-containing protein n=1 Tax=Hibiscus sabdariffa TaxID=183260 RepID=A0ABR2EPJ2_9ROSI